MGIISKIIKGIFNDVERSLFSSFDGAGSTKGLNEKNTPIMAGDVEIEELTLFSEDGQRFMDLINHCKVINIYESILSPVIFAELEIVDSIGMLQNFPIITEEHVSITFKTPSSSKSAKYFMRVTAIENKRLTDNNKAIVYTLKLASSEIYSNSTNLLTRKCDGSISQEVKKILEEDLGTFKPINIEETNGIEESLISITNPFKAIDFLRQRAVSKSNVSSSFVFFENRNGYHFVTIEKLMDIGKKAATDESDKIFFFDNVSTNMGVENVNIRNIVAYNQVAFADGATRLQEGGVTNVVNSVNPLTASIQRTNYTNNESQDRFKTIDDNSVSLNTSSFDKKHGKAPSKITLVPTKEGSQIPEKLAILRSFVQKITQNIVQIHVYGDSDITAGDVIMCRLPSGSGMTDDVDEARLDTGNYLITKVRHIILNSDRPQHTMAFELIKGSFLEK